MNSKRHINSSGATGKIDESNSKQMQLRLAMEMAGVVHWEYDIQRDLFCFDDHLYAFFGTSAAEQGGYQMTAAEYARRFVPLEEAHIVWRELNRAQASDNPNFVGRIEHRIRRADGSERNVGVFFRTIRDETGRPIKTCGAVQDFTERKQTEEALRQSEYRYRSLFNRMSEGFALMEIIFDRGGEPCDFRYLDVNPAFEQLTGLKKTNIVGKTLLEIWPKLTNKSQWIFALGQVALHAQAAHFERYSEAFGGHVDVFAYSPAAGQCACVFKGAEARKQAENALQASRERLQLAVDLTELGTFEVNLQTGHRVWSKLARSHFGLTPEAAIDNTTFLRGVHPRDRLRMEQVFREALCPESGGYYAAEFRTIGLQDGVERWVSVRGQVFFGSEGRAARLSGVTLDITARKMAEEEMCSLAMFTQQNPNPVLRISSDHILCCHNQAAEDLCREWGCVVGQPVPSDVAELVTASLTNGMTLHHEIGKNESTFLLTFSPEIEDGHVNVYGTDITGRKLKGKEHLKREESLPLINEADCRANNSVNVQSCWDGPSQSGTIA